MSEQATSNELVARLRALPDRLRRTPVHLGEHIKLLQGAADEIERLQRDHSEDMDRMERAAEALEKVTDESTALALEVERLKNSAPEPGATSCAAMDSPGVAIGFGLFVVVPWLWRLLKPWIHQVTG